MEKDLKWIKKHYGEKMMHLCRECFPKILETEGLLPSLLKEHFPQSHFLASDIERQECEDDFKNYIYSLVDVEKSNKVVKNKSAVELMDEAGYILYPECKSEKDIQSFKKWWKQGEELCTFRGGRLNTCRVWFAVKKRADKIKREKFISPTRQDEYGTSVISIQFSRGENQYLSIKNRYNHTVNNPDNTFNSNLDNIIDGLTDAFEKDYGVRNCNGNKPLFELEKYVCVDGKYYHFNHEINNVYYCDGGIIIDNFNVKKLPDHQMLIDYFIVDFNKKTISLYDKTINDSFCKTIGKIEKMSFEDGIIKLTTEDGNEIEIGKSERNEIVSYKNQKIKEIGDKFLCYNEKIEELDLPSLENVGEDFLYSNLKLCKIDLQSLQKVGENFLAYNEELCELNLPNLESVGNDFLYFNHLICQLNLPNLQSAGDGFLKYNEQLKKIDLPCLQEVGDSFIGTNERISEVKMPNLQKTGDFFLGYNQQLRKLNLPNLQSVGNSFLYGNQSLFKLRVPKLEHKGYTFLYFNERIEQDEPCRE